MQRSAYGKCLLSAVCILVLANCARHKVTPFSNFLPSPPVMDAPVGSPPVLSEIRAAQPEKAVSQAERGAPEVSRLILEPPRMGLSAGLHAPREDVVKNGDIRFLVVIGDGTLRPDSKVTIQDALKALASELLFLCPDRMRAGSAEECSFTAKRSLNDLFKDQLLEQGVPASQATAVTVLAHADLTSPDKGAFDIHAEHAASSDEQSWRVVPRNPGDHKLELRTTLGARIAAAEDVQGAPVVLVHSVSVTGGKTFLNEYWQAMIRGLAALALFAWIARALWRSARPSV
jgi:hypothetical protein